MCFRGGVYASVYIELYWNCKESGLGSKAFFSGKYWDIKKSQTTKYQQFAILPMAN